MSQKWKLSYGVAAVLAAIIVISVALVAYPLVQNQFSNTAPFLVLLTDPPIVPEGTTNLNLTYSNILLHVTYPDKTVAWLPIEATGTVNLLSLVNMSKTLASINLPIDTEVDKIQFTIANVNTTVHGIDYNVTALSNTLVLRFDNSKVNHTLTGVLVDLSPTLVQINGVDANGETVNYFVLAPSATARIVSGLDQEQSKVGTVVKLDEDEHEELEEDEEDFASQVTITSASLTVDGDKTTLSVTLKNQGTNDFRIFGLTLRGDFNPTTFEDDHAITIPFKITGTTLNPTFGSDHGDDHEDEYEHAPIPSLTLQSGQEITLAFSGIINLQHEEDHPSTVIVPIAGNTYNLHLMGEGFQTFAVKAT